MEFGFKIEGSGKNLRLRFDLEVESNVRKLSELVNDEVILDVDNARKLLREKGDITIYEVFNLWKFNKDAERFLKKYGLMIDITFLKSGVFSTKKNGEAFCTYGHIHEENLGEVYKVLKNYCYLLLSNKRNFKSYLVKLKEGYSFFIHPSYMHRLISGNKDCVVLNFVPEDAGHDYDVVKKKGFPFHVFHENGKLVFKENKKYPETSLVLIEDMKKFDVVEIAEKKPSRLRKILRSPNDMRKFLQDYSF
ncbi:MAG: glucose-6-phosphate isomerase family protein [Candidatus Aenigmatarchaeota archaeon]